MILLKNFGISISCETAIQSIIDNWKTLDSKKVILALFVDFRKAFDLVDQKVLWRKHFHYGFDNGALSLIFNYFLNRSQITKKSNSFSSKAGLELGVPQGLILGPLLFLIFINNLALVNYPNLVLFADDTTIYDADSSFEVLLAIVLLRSICLATK